MVRSFAILAAFGLAVFLGVPGSSQEIPCFHRLLPVTVEDSKGVSIKDLQAGDLQTKLRAGPMKIVSLGPDTRPHRLVILIDASGSMATQRRRVGVLTAALAETPLPNTKIAMMVFSDRIDEEISFSQPESMITERLRQINSPGGGSLLSFHGRTALYDSLLAGLRMLETPTSADSLYLISDGADDASRAKFDQVERSLTSSGVRLFVSLMLASISNRHPTPAETAGPQEMRELVHRTGGEILIGSDEATSTRGKVSEQSTDVIHALAQRVTQDYLLEVELPTSLRKPMPWDLKLSPEDRKRWKSAQINYPAEMVPCTP